jgi:hypothetical protein
MRSPWSQLRAGAERYQQLANWLALLALLAIGIVWPIR